MTVATPDATTVPVAYRDVRAGDLALSFARRPRTALRASTIALGAARVELRVLAASHQVLLEDRGRLVATETVACRAVRAGSGPLPETAEWSGDGWRLRFSSHVRTLGADGFAASARRLATLLAPDPHAVVGVFPGDGLAVTALRGGRLRDGIVGWRTWHAYPQTRQLVTTWTTATEGSL